jgi:hypothetical protein
MFGVAELDIQCRCSVYDVLEGLEPSMRRIRDLEGDDGYSSEKAKSRIVPYQSFETWAKPQGWTADKGWPRITTTAAQADKAVKATPTVKTGLQKAEKEISRSSVENGIISRPDGSILARIKGTTEKSVDIPSDMVPMLEGNIFSHNHPRGGSLSMGDVGILSGYKVSEIRAVGPTHTYSMKPPDSGWGPGWWSEKFEVYKKAEKDYARKVSKAHNAGVVDIPIEDLNKWNPWDVFASKTGVIYKSWENEK